ncbi:MAG TPA: hypothetical protein VHN74_14310 [Candidatus Angelobacter sp.]|jgi:hypothetical protein|nr:hypothetical protein [Candidatus Angelobacter sp.]
MHSFWKWMLWTLGIIPRVIQTVLLTAFVLPVFCDVKMWRAMIRDVWRLPGSRASVPKFEVIRGKKTSVEEQRRVSGE